MKLSREWNLYHNVPQSFDLSDKPSVFRYSVNLPLGRSISEAFVQLHSSGSYIDSNFSVLMQYASVPSSLLETR